MKIGVPDSLASPCEFTGEKFVAIMEQEKINSNFGLSHTPEHNGTVGRLNKTIQCKIRALMIDSRLPRSMWNFALESAVYIYIIEIHMVLSTLKHLCKCFSLKPNTMKTNSDDLDVLLIQKFLLLRPNSQREP